ncbi:MAG TPA: hypothetical protein VG013_36475 [Gemmataceae bacterium]|jgi:hypothetical protein|nr:hypothetical protein [Gemmataceae bacterium]
MTEDDDLRRELARHALTLGLGEAEHARMRELAKRNQDGLLSPEEREELQNYDKTVNLLALLHSKARKVLEQGEDC